MAALAKEKARQARLMGSDKEPTRALTPNVLRCVDDLLLNAVQLTGTLKGPESFLECSIIAFGRRHSLDSPSRKAL